MCCVPLPITDSEYVVFGVSAPNLRHSEFSLTSSLFLLLSCRRHLLKKALKNNVCHNLEYEESLFTSQVGSSSFHFTAHI